MNIATWFLIIAISALLLSIIILAFMYKKNKLMPAVIISVWFMFLILAGALYVSVLFQGGQITDTKLVASFDIEDVTYASQTSQAGSAYAFYTTNGIEFSFDSLDMLEEAPANPKEVELYVCTIRYGYDWCFISEDTIVKYKLR